jgi:RNA polymerase sigma factor (sigma-70 family)
MAGRPLGAVVRYLEHLTGAGALSGEVLLRRYAERGDEAAFTALVQRYGPLVLSVCRRVLRQAQDAEDAFQATFLVLARKASTIRKVPSLSSWLYGVAYRLALKARASAARRKVRERRAAGPASAAPQEEVLYRELRSVLDDEVQRLPWKYRAPLILCCLEGRSFEETVRQLGWPRGTVAVRLARGKERLRARLARRGLTLSAALLTHLLARSLASAALPASLLRATARAAVSFARGKTAGAGAAGRPAVMAKAILPGKLAPNLVLVPVAVLTLAVLTAGAVLVAHRPTGSGTPAAPGPGPSSASGKSVLGGGPVARLRKWADKRPRLVPDLAPQPLLPEKAVAVHAPAAQAIPLAFQTAPLAFQAVPVEVFQSTAGRPFNGLRLILQADRAETVLNEDGTNIEPVSLRLTFANVSRQPFNLETSALSDQHLTFQVAGPDLQSVRRRKLGGGVRGQPSPSDISAIAPGQTWTAGKGLCFPPRQGPTAFALVKPGVYRIRVTYVHRPTQRSGLGGIWTGTVVSNEIRLRVLPPR